MEIQDRTLNNFEIVILLEKNFQKLLDKISFLKTKEEIQK